MRLDEIGLQAHRFLKLDDRRFRVARRAEGPAVQHPRFPAVRLQSRRFLERREGFLVVRDKGFRAAGEIHADLAEFQPGLAHVLVKRDRLLEGGHGVCRPSLIPPDASQDVPGSRRVRPQDDGPLRGGLGLRQPSQFAQHGRQIQLDRGTVRTHLQGGSEVLDRLGLAVWLVRQMQRQRDVRARSRWGDPAGRFPGIAPFPPALRPCWTRPR